ncbi:MAG: cytochrome c oxidase subunit II [Thermomicrobiales bacterium]|nr:cytochrome c oxidase subunit II [Thermomicrobiales bacterium]
MSRFGPRRGDSQTSHGKRGARAIPMLALVGVVGLLAGCGPEVAQPYSTISPQNFKTEQIQWLYQIIFWAALIVFVAVQLAIAYVVIRFRRRNNVRPEQVHGSKVLEIAWTVLPALILLALFIPTIKVIFEQAQAAQVEDGFKVEVVGKQWWWEIAYPDIAANPADTSAGPLVTANELVVPVGANVVLSMQSNNVIHSFWVPQLSGKVDVMPGHENKLQFTAERVGDYFGECAEYCGSAHAWMRFKVKVVPQENFDAWVAAWRTPPTDGNPATADVVDAPPAFGACLACHRVNGTNAVIAGQGMPYISGYRDPETQEIVPGPGPNLTLLACRDTIGAGILENTPENLEKWLKHTDEVKEGVYMPNYYKQGMTDEQITEVVNWLSSLKPAGGCPDANMPVGSLLDPAVVRDVPALASPVASPAAAPAASPVATPAGS